MSERSWKDILKDAAFWTAVFTAMLTLFTYMLYKVSKSTDETSRATQRAFLSFSNFGLGPRMSDANGRWAGQEISANWVNSGSTPAMDAIIKGNVQTWQSELPHGFDFLDSKDRTLAVIGPHSTYGTNSIVSLADLTSSWQGKARIYFWGSVIYKDIFAGDPDRLSEFCMELTHIAVGSAPPGTLPTTPGTSAPALAPTVMMPTITDPNAIIGGFQWQACKEHNCYDEDCKDYTAKVKELREP